jgi:hypothetical protein
MSFLLQGSIPSTLLHTTPFLCPCVKELWVITIHFLDFLSASHDIKVSKTLQNFCTWQIYVI